MNIWKLLDKNIGTENFDYLDQFKQLLSLNNKPSITIYGIEPESFSALIANLRELGIENILTMSDQQTLEEIKQALMIQNTKKATHGLLVLSGRDTRRLDREACRMCDLVLMDSDVLFRQSFSSANSLTEFWKSALVCASDIRNIRQASKCSKKYLEKCLWDNTPQLRYRFDLGAYGQMNSAQIAIQNLKQAARLNELEHLDIQDWRWPVGHGSLLRLRRINSHNRLKPSYSLDGIGPTEVLDNCFCRLIFSISLREASAEMILNRFSEKAVRSKRLRTVYDLPFCIDTELSVNAPGSGTLISSPQLLIYDNNEEAAETMAREVFGLKSKDGTRLAHSSHHGDWWTL